MAHVINIICQDILKNIDEVIVKNFEAIKTFCYSEYETFGNIALTNGDKNKIEELIPLLKPFYETTLDLSGSSYPTIGMCLMLMENIQIHIENMFTSNSFPSFIDAPFTLKVTKKINHYIHTFLSMESYIRTLLDPRIKKVHMFNLLNTHENFIQFKEIFEKYASTLSSGIKSNKEISLRERIARDRLMGTGTSAEKDDNEIQSYLSDILYPTNILDWWEGNRFRILAKIAMDYLPQQATSVACERIFSKASDKITKKRNRMNPKMVQSMMTLESWIKNG
ncbi:uncharacterized protein LOC135925402 [Gordionus sp. m RMFG-2023]|uniref:uncharacterized protein LOC135925402 n=1 Tax=Gordionus sp. m RMFG-2023 TaxID=3053472 RepID=UPI0031FD4FCF